MPLSRRYYNLIGLFKGNYSYSGHALTIKRKGPNHLRMFKPSDLSHKNVKPLLDAGNMPEEAKWFYVESVKVQTKIDGDNNQNYVKGRGHDDVTVSPVYVFNEQFRQYLEKPYIKGLSCKTMDETYETNVNGKIITKNKLEVSTRPSTDDWMLRFQPGISGPPGVNARLMETLTDHGVTTYTQTILDTFSFYTFSVPEDMRDRFGGKTMLPVIALSAYEFMYNPPVEIDLSFIGRPLTTNNYLQLGNGMRNYLYSSSVNPGLGTFDFTGIQDNRYPVSPGFPRINIETVTMSSLPLLNRYRFQLPSIIFPTSTNEEEDYNVMNQNYSRTYRRNRLLGLLFDAAGLVNPLTFTATFVRMMINIPNLYMDYIDEQARINDAKNNFEGFDMPFYYSPKVYRHLLVLDSGQTQTITMPTRKIEFMENGERTYETENRFIELPINKLFKSIEEFESYMEDLNLPLRTLQNKYVYVKLEPYMELSEYGNAYETWAKIGDPGLENW